LASSRPHAPSPLPPISSSAPLPALAASPSLITRCEGIFPSICNPP
jgi:hypothetical protein